MTKVFLISNTLIVVCPDGYITGQVYTSRHHAVQRYFDVCDVLCDNNLLSDESSIIK